MHSLEIFSGNTSYSCPSEMTANKTSWGKVLLITQVLEGHGSVCFGRHYSFAGLLSWALHQQCRYKKFDTFCKRSWKELIYPLLSKRADRFPQLGIFHCRSSSLWSWKCGRGMQVGMGLWQSPTFLQASLWHRPTLAKAAHTWLWPKRANPTALGKQKASNQW